MRYFEMQPLARLSELVQCFWYLEKDYGPAAPGVGEWIFPDGTTDFVVQRRGFFCDAHGPLPTSFFVGPQSAPLLLRSQGRIAAVGVRFHAHGVYGVFQQSLAAFANRIVAAAALTGAPGGEIEEQIISATPLAACGLLEGFLLSCVPANEGPNLQIQACVQWLRHTSGAAPVSGLAARVNLSSRQLERRFRVCTGFPPKQLARIIRFNAVRDQLMIRPDTDLAELAHAAHYYDQAHFIRDFQGLAGLTPAGFARDVVAGRFRFNR